MLNENSKTYLNIFSFLIFKVRKRKNIIPLQKYGETKHLIRKLHRAHTKSLFSRLLAVIKIKWTREKDMNKFLAYFEKVWLGKFVNLQIYLLPPGYSSSNSE